MMAWTMKPTKPCIRAQMGPAQKRLTAQSTTSPVSSDCARAAMSGSLLKARARGMQDSRNGRPAQRADPVTRTDFVRRVGLQLNALRWDGKIERIGKESALRWRLLEDTVL